MFIKVTQHSRSIPVSLPGNVSMNSFRNVSAVAATVLALVLCGCSGLPVNQVTPVKGTPSTSTDFSGAAYGGSQPIVGSKIYLYAVGTTGYGSVSTSLLSIGGLDYATTSPSGSFSISGKYSCPSATSLVYLLGIGGDLGAGQNDKIALMALLGNCQTLQANAATTYVKLNEASTVASIYALSPFMTSTTAIGAPESNLAGITNAFAQDPNIVSLAYGSAWLLTPSANGVVPYRKINTVANFLTLCVNSSGAVTGGNTTGCDHVLGLTTVNGVVPSDVAQAVLSIVQHPTNNASDIYYAVLPASPFQPTLTSVPSDLTMAVEYKGGGISTPQGIAVDASGNAWVASANNAVTELSAATGSFLSGAAGFTGGSLDAPASIAVDTAGNVWIANCGGQCSGTANASSVTMMTSVSGTVTASNFNGGSLSGAYGIAVDGTNRSWIANALGTSLTLFNSAGVLQSGIQGYGASFQSNPVSVAVDMNGNVWSVSPSANAVSEFTSTGAPGANSYQGTGVSYPYAVAMDATNRPWVLNQTANSLTILNAGSPVPGSPFSGGGLSLPNALAFDGNGTAWITNGNGSISAFSSTGAALTATPYNPGSMHANGIAVDGSGSLWITSCGSYCTGSGSDPGSVFQILGVAAPVVTPISLGVLSRKLASKP